MRLQIFILMIMLLPLASCVTELAWEESVSVETKLVVEGLLTSETKQHYVKLSSTRGVIVEGDAAPVSNAEVSISDGEQTFMLTETSPGLYLTDLTVAGELGKVYTLRVAWAGQLFEATDSMVEASIPQDVELRESERFPGFYFITYPGNFGAEAPAKLHLQVSTPADWRENFPPAFNIPNFWQDKAEGYLAKDTSYYLHPYLETPAVLAYGQLEIGLYPLGSAVNLKHYSLSEGYYAFIRSLMAETEWKGLGPFGYHPANLPTNLSNGAVGYFGTSHVKAYKHIIME